MSEVTVFLMRVALWSVLALSFISAVAAMAIAGSVP